MKKFTLNNFLFLMGLMLFASGLSAQSTIYVKGDVMGGDGSSWAMAYQYLDDAVAAAQDGDQIWVAAGTYIPGGAAPSRDTFFTLKNGVDVYGGFAGTETMLSERDFAANVTILSGDIDGDDGMEDFFSAARFANAKNVFIIDTMVQDAIVDGFTISHAHTDTAAASPDQRGGGMLIFGAPTVRNCTFESNYANLGGAAYPRFAGATGTTFENCTFTGNRAVSGGAVFTVGADDVMFIDCDFLNNQADGSGGAMFPRDGFDMTIQGCTFRGNTAPGGSGGAILPVAITGLTIENTRFVRNTCGSSGGAIRIENTLFTMDQVTIDSNDAGAFGGGILSLSCDFTIENSLFSANLCGTGAGEGGGALYAGAFGGETADFLVQNTTFSFNTAPFGGAVANYGVTGDPSAVTGVYDNVTWSGNTGETAGGAMSVSFSGSAIMLNCDMSNQNTAQAGGAIFTSRDNSSLVAENCTFENNTASTFGGGACYLAANAVHVFDSCYFAGNVSTGGFGGAINYLPDSFITNVLVVDQCHFLNNNGFDQGGALNINDGDVQITNSLFNFNRVTPDAMAGAIAGRGGFLANNCGTGDTSRILMVHNTVANSEGDFASGVSQWEADSTTCSAQLVMLNNVFPVLYASGPDYAIEAGMPEVTSLGGNQTSGTSFMPYLTGTNDNTGVIDFGFVDEFSDFNLLETSPLRNIAVIVPGLTLDVDHAGNPRGNMPDIGGYEFFDPMVNTRPEIGDANSLQLNPNPAVDYTLLTLTNDYTGEVNIRVSNVIGQTISISQQEKNTKEYQFQLNTSNLTPGLYEISLEFENQVVTRKLVKRR